jgi:transposase InsO family protein
MLVRLAAMSRDGSARHAHPLAPQSFRLALDQNGATPGAALRGDGTSHRGVDHAADAGSFPWDAAPRYVLRDRDAIYGRDFAAMIRHMGIEEVLTAPRSPWQNPFAERLVGSIRRECLDHVIVWNERSLRRTLHNYFAYYQWSRTHLALGKDAPKSRAVEPPEQGRVVAIPQVGGLHHRYQRRAA